MWNNTRIDKHNAKKIEINDPKYGHWLDKQNHRKKSWEYNQEWGKFFNENNIDELTIDEIELAMEDIMFKVFEIEL